MQKALARATLILAMVIVSIAVWYVEAFRNSQMQARYESVCVKHGWIVIDTAPFAVPKCLDEKTGLMYLPPELRFAK